MCVERRIGSSRFTVDSASFPRRTKSGDDFLLHLSHIIPSCIMFVNHPNPSDQRSIRSVGSMVERPPPIKACRGHLRIERKVVGSSPMLIVLLPSAGPVWPNQ